MVQLILSNDWFSVWLVLLRLIWKLFLQGPKPSDDFCGKGICGLPFEKLFENIYLDVIYLMARFDFKLFRLL